MDIKIELLTSVVSAFPSGSSINYYKDKLYLVGDDATGILILDSQYTALKEVKFFDYPGKRIPKAEKIDLETSTILTHPDGDSLCIIGSGSKKRRAIVFIMPLHDAATGDWTSVDYLKFAKRLKASGLDELNIEGSTLIGNQFILANRCNAVNQTNYLVVTSTLFWNNQHDAIFSIKPILIPGRENLPLGVSELCYVQEYDVLLLVMSLEDTSNAYDDGVIGDSYIGWVTSIREKLNSPEIVLSGMLNLTTISGQFNQQKVEGICVEHNNGNEFILHLVSDNDLGDSKLFKIKMTVN